MQDTGQDEPFQARGQEARMLGSYLQTLAGNLSDRLGTPTLLNGQTVPATWRRAQPNRIQMFLGEGHEGKPVYEVSFHAEVLQEPWALTDEMTVTWLATGWRGVIRTHDLVDVQGIPVRVIAFVELMSE